MKNIINMPENTETTPTPPPAAQPQDILAEGSTNAIDLDAVEVQISSGLQYIQDSRTDFGEEVQLDELDDLLAKLEETKKLIRDLQIDHADGLIEWKDEDGSLHEILLSEQDPERFAKANSLFAQTQRELNAYVKKHYDYLRNNPEVLDTLGVEY